MTLKIEAGKFYRTRDGRKVGPMMPFKGEYHFTAWLDGAKQLWSDIGSRAFRSGHSSDLIAEWTDEPAAPEVGTLRELGVKPGDVVECVDNIAARESLTVGKQYVIDCDGTPIDDNLGNWAWTKAKFRIISRASEALPYGHARLPSGKVVDLTAIEKPFGMLDAETQEALRAHGGPLECWNGSEWVGMSRIYDSDSGFAYRIAPNPPKPVVGEVVMVGSAECGFDHPKWGTLSDTNRLTLPTRDGQLVAGTYTGPDGLEFKVEAL